MGEHVTAVWGTRSGGPGLREVARHGDGDIEIGMRRTPPPG